MARRTLVLGYGNPGRLDDGLGPAVVRALEARGLEGVTCDADYQLRLEDAAEIARHDAVVFVDAAAAGPEPFSYERVEPEPGRRFTTHSVPPGALLSVARTCFGVDVPARLLAVRGYDFDAFGERLSDAAVRNLEAAVAFLERTLAPRKGVIHA